MGEWGVRVCGKSDEGSSAVWVGYKRAKVQRRDELCSHLGVPLPSLSLTLLSFACEDN